MKFVLFLECSEDAMKARITKRGEEAGENVHDRTFRKSFAWALEFGVEMFSRIFLKI